MSDAYEYYEPRPKRKRDDKEEENMEQQYESEDWEEERRLIMAAKDKYFANVRSLTEELAEIQCQLVRAETQREVATATTARERSEHAQELAELQQSLHEVEEQLSKKRREATEQNSTAIKARSQIESQLHHEQCVVQTLRDREDALLTELQESRNEMRKTEPVVEDLYEKVSRLESQLHRREAEFEAHIREKDAIIEAKERALQSLAADGSSSGRQSAVSYFNPLQVQRRSELNDEASQLRKQLADSQAEVDYHVQRYAELLRESHGRPLRIDSDRQRWEDTSANRVQQLDAKVVEQMSTIHAQTEHIEKLKNRMVELERDNTMLIAKFGSDLMPAYFDDASMIIDDDMAPQFSNIQELIKENIKMQQELDAQSTTGDGKLKAQYAALEQQSERVSRELETLKKQVAEDKAKMREQQKSLEYYKMKYEQLGVEGDADEPPRLPTPDGGQTQAPRTKVEYEVEMHKLRCEVAAAADRYKYTIDEKQRKERDYETLLTQKNEHITQLQQTKTALELTANKQTNVTETMQKQLDELDKLNRKLDEQKQKALAEHKVFKAKIDDAQTRYDEMEAENRNFKKLRSTLETELDLSRHELAQLRSRVLMLQENESVSATVTGALSEFRSAYTKLDSVQLTDTKQQLQSVRDENSTLSEFVKVMHLQQMFTMDKLKSALTDCQLQRDHNLKRSETLEQQLNTLQLEYGEVKEKYEALNKQMTEIDASDVSLESCRKQIQQLRNRIAYLERTVSATMAGSERWKAQLDISEQQCRTFKQLATDMENALREKDEQAQRERQQLEERVADSGAELQEARATVEALRAEVVTLQAADAEGVAAQGRVADEWQTLTAEQTARADALHGALDSAKNALHRAQARVSELESTVTQQAAEMEQLRVAEAAQQERLNERDREADLRATEVALLSDRLKTADDLQIEVKRTYEYELESVRNELAEHERKALEARDSGHSVQSTLSELVDRIVADADALPLQLPSLEFMTREHATRATQIMEKLRVERNEEAQRRRAAIAELQRRAATSDDAAGDSASLAAIQATVAMLNAKVEAKDSEIERMRAQTGQVEEVRAALQEEQEKTQQLRDVARRFRATNNLAVSVMRDCTQCNTRLQQAIEARNAGQSGGGGGDAIASGSL